MKRREEKYLTHLWSMFCGKENEMEEHYFVDEDNQKMYMKLTYMHNGELAEDEIIGETYTGDVVMQKGWAEITNPETIIWVYELNKTK